MESIVRKTYQKSRDALRSLDNQQNIVKQSPKPSKANYDSLRVEFANLSSKGVSDRMAKQNLNLANWSSFLGIDMTKLDIESQLMNLVDSIDQKMYQLVIKTNEEYKVKNKTKTVIREIEKLQETASCNWEYLEKLSHLLHVHFNNACRYHLFHQKLLEYQLQLPQIGVSERVKVYKDQYVGDYEEANGLYIVVKDHLSRFLRWWKKIEDIIVESRKLKPLGLRTGDFGFKRSAKILVDYKDKDQRQLYRSDAVLVSKTSSTNQYWCVHQPIGTPSPYTNSKFFSEPPASSNVSQEQIPSICVELDPPDVCAIERALLLRLDLLASWTSGIREIGCCIMSYIATVLGYWAKIDISNLQANSNSKKEDILNSLETIESLLHTYWSNSSQFLFLQNKMKILKSELDIQDENDAGILAEETQIERNSMFIKISPQTLDTLKSQTAISRSDTFIYQKKSIAILVNKYKDLHKYWDEYKKLVDNSTELQLICDIRNNTESLLDNASLVPDELLSYLSSDDQQGWSKYLSLLSEKLHSHNYHYHSHQSTAGSIRTPSVMSTARSSLYPHQPSPNTTLINALPKELKLTNKTEETDFVNARHSSKIELNIPVEKEIRFFKPNTQRSAQSSSTSKKRRPKSNTMPNLARDVDISRYYTNSLIPNAKISTTNTIIEGHNDLASTPRNNSRYSTLQMSGPTSFYEHLNEHTPSVFTPNSSKPSTLNRQVFFNTTTTADLTSPCVVETPPEITPRIPDTLPKRTVRKSAHTHTNINNSDIDVSHLSVANSPRHFRQNTVPLFNNSVSTLLPEPNSPKTPQFHTKSSTLNSQKIEDLDKVTLMRNKECIQSGYLVATVPDKTRIESILDKHLDQYISPNQAIEKQLVDSYFLQVLDTVTHTKLPFSAAVLAGLVQLIKEDADEGKMFRSLTRSSSTLERKNDSLKGRFIFNSIPSNTTRFQKNNTSRISTSDCYEKIVFKVSGILDPDKAEWVSLKEAVNRGVLSLQSGMLKLNGVRQHNEHILLTIKHAMHVNATRLYHCNFRSLPPEMTVELAKL